MPAGSPRGERAVLVEARRRDAQRRPDIIEALAVMADDIEAGGHGVEGSELFHAAVTTVGHSALLQRLMGEISELGTEPRIESPSQPDRPAESLAGPAGSPPRSTTGTPPAPQP